MIVLMGLHSNVAFAQDKEEKEVKEEKVEKKKKEKKDSGKIEQSGKGEGVVKYRRSSLHTMIIQDDKLPKADIILKSFNEAPFPDKAIQRCRGYPTSPRHADRFGSVEENFDRRADH